MLWAINMAALLIVLLAVGTVVVGMILMPLSKLYYWLEEIPDEIDIDTTRNAHGDERTRKSSVRRLHVD